MEVLFGVCFGLVSIVLLGLFLVRGGSTPGSLNLSLKGRLDPSGLSPEVTEWVTPDFAAGHRNSG